MFLVIVLYCSISSLLSKNRRKGTKYKYIKQLRIYNFLNNYFLLQKKSVGIANIGDTHTYKPLILFRIPLLRRVACASVT